MKSCTKFKSIHKATNFREKKKFSVITQKLITASFWVTPKEPFVHYWKISDQARKCEFQSELSLIAIRDYGKSLKASPTRTNYSEIVVTISPAMFMIIRIHYSAANCEWYENVFSMNKLRDFHEKSIFFQPSFSWFSDCCLYRSEPTQFNLSFLLFVIDFASV